MNKRALFSTAFSVPNDVPCLQRYRLVHGELKVLLSADLSRIYSVGASEIKSCWKVGNEIKRGKMEVAEGGYYWEWGRVFDIC